MKFVGALWETDEDPKVDVVATRNVKDLSVRKELISVVPSLTVGAKPTGILFDQPSILPGLSVVWTMGQ